MYKKIIGYAAILLLIVTATLPALAVSTMKNTDTPQQQNITLRDRLDNLFFTLMKRAKFGYSLFLKFITRGIIAARSSDVGTLVMKVTESQIKQPQSDLLITDALVTISQVKVHFNGPSGTQVTPTWITVENTPKTFDLVHLESTPYDLAQIQINVGSYDQIDVFISSALVTINGKQYNLFISPQNVQLNVPFTIKGAQKLTLTLVFDLADSIQELSGHKFVMKPVIKVV